jgi:hypothetical protein
MNQVKLYDKPGRNAGLPLLNLSKLKVCSSNLDMLHPKVANIDPPMF